MKGEQSLLDMTVDAEPLEGSAALVSQALGLMKEAERLMLEELKAPGLSLEYVVRLKRALGECLKHGRSYALEAERQLGFCLLGKRGEGEI